MTFTSVADFNALLQRKALVGALLVADYETAALTALTTGASPTAAALADLTGYSSLGKLTNDGTSLSGEVEKQEQRGWGDAYPSRIDVTSENLTLTCSGMETNKATLDAFYNVDLSSVTPSATTGEITFDKPPVPELRDKRVLALMRDVSKSSGADVFIGIHFPRCNITNNGDQQFANNEGGINYPVSIQALLDDTEGTAMRWFMGGPGAADLMSGMGFSA